MPAGLSPLSSPLGMCFDSPVPTVLLFHFMFVFPRQWPLPLAPDCVDGHATVLAGLLFPPRTRACNTHACMSRTPFCFACPALPPRVKYPLLFVSFFDVTRPCLLRQGRPVVQHGWDLHINSYQRISYYESSLWFKLEQLRNGRQPSKEGRERFLAADRGGKTGIQLQITGRYGACAGLWTVRRLTCCKCRAPSPGIQQ